MYKGAGLFSVHRNRAKPKSSIQSCGMSILFNSFATSLDHCRWLCAISSPLKCDYCCWCWLVAAWQQQSRRYDDALAPNSDADADDGRQCPPVSTTTTNKKEHRMQCNGNNNHRFVKGAEGESGRIGGGRRSNWRARGLGDWIVYACERTLDAMTFLF